MKNDIIFGLLGDVLGRKDQCIAQTIHYNDGQVVTSTAVQFEGGYDDYNGVMAWARLKEPQECTYLRRFSPKPGVWMTGIRIS